MAQEANPQSPRLIPAPVEEPNRITTAQWMPDGSGKPAGLPLYFGRLRICSVQPEPKLNNGFRLIAPMLFT
jgi:hypothetical protein